NGGFKSTFALPGVDPEKRNKRFTMTVGNGSAHVELESFGGTIALRRPTDPRPETEKKRTREKDKDFAGMAAVQPEIAAAIALAQPEIDAAIAEASEAVRTFVMPRIAPMPNPVPMPRVIVPRPR